MQNLEFLVVIKNEFKDNQNFIIFLTYAHKENIKIWEITYNLKANIKCKKLNQIIIAKDTLIHDIKIINNEIFAIDNNYIMKWKFNDNLTSISDQ